MIHSPSLPKPVSCFLSNNWAEVFNEFGLTGQTNVGSSFDVSLLVPLFKNEFIPLVSGTNQA